MAKALSAKETDLLNQQCVQCGQKLYIGAIHVISQRDRISRVMCGECLCEERLDLPSPADIAQATAELRSTWKERDYQVRAGHTPMAIELTPQPLIFSNGSKFR